MNIQFNPTGIVRPIDELGRVVIPKEYRRVLEIKDNDPMEIMFDKTNGLIVIAKFHSQYEGDGK
jgi:transcriptional pleiotropic regulator of transition state genes